MEHKLSKTKVYQTKDYNAFSIIDGNRGLNKKKMERIIAEISAGNDILDEVPILVKEQGKKMAILDGQHRFHIAQTLDRPVHYIIKKEDMTLHNVAKVNSNVEKWSDKDFINCYTTLGNPHYKQLGKFHETYGIAVGVCLVLLRHGKIKNEGGSWSMEKLRQEFETGIYEVKKLKEATMIAEVCKTFEKFPYWHSRSFVIAICRILEAGLVEMDVLLKKFNSAPEELKQHANFKDYMVALEVIYNKGNSKRRPIY